MTKEELRRNVGGHNSGCFNVGCCNTGDYNVGSWNAGNYNKGNFNTGDCNVGDCNAGRWNLGDYNSGFFNTGDYNSGCWNSGNHNSGFFNTEKEPTVRMFNKDTGLTRDELVATRLPGFLYFDLTVWVSCDTATEEEMKIHKQEIETCGGFLKILEYKEAFKLAWSKASKEEHKQVLALPNFDANIFYEISGIDVTKEC